VKKEPEWPDFARERAAMLQEHQRVIGSEKRILELRGPKAIEKCMRKVLQRKAADEAGIEVLRSKEQHAEPPQTSPPAVAAPAVAAPAAPPGASQQDADNDKD
jgi:hypothetical protein